jgi:hypothetical protein
LQQEYVCGNKFSEARTQQCGLSDKVPPSVTVFEFAAKGAGGLRAKGGPGVREELKDHMDWAKDYQQNEQDFQSILKALGEHRSCPGFPCKWRVSAAVVRLAAARFRAVVGLLWGACSAAQQGADSVALKALSRLTVMPSVDSCFVWSRKAALIHGSLPAGYLSSECMQACAALRGSMCLLCRTERDRSRGSAFWDRRRIGAAACIVHNS